MQSVNDPKIWTYSVALETGQWAFGYMYTPINDVDEYDEWCDESFMTTDDARAVAAAADALYNHVSVSNELRKLAEIDYMVSSSDCAEAKAMLNDIFKQKP